MLFYLDPITTEKSNFDESTIAYIVRVDTNKYSIRGISAGLEALAKDPTSNAQFYWPLDAKNLLTNVAAHPVIFPDEELTSALLTLEQVIQFLGINPTQIPSIRFNTAIGQQNSTNWRHGVQTDHPNANDEQPLPPGAILPTTLNQPLTQHTLFRSPRYSLGVVSSNNSFSNFLNINDGNGPATRIKMLADDFPEGHDQIIARVLDHQYFGNIIAPIYGIDSVTQVQKIANAFPQHQAQIVEKILDDQYFGKIIAPIYGFSSVEQLRRLCVIFPNSQQQLQTKFTTFDNPNTHRAPNQF